MGTTDVLIRVMALAFVGWLATSYRIKHSRLRPQWRQRIVVPLWFVWMAFALGGPVYSGALPLNDALIVGASLTVGICVSILMRSLQAHRRSR
jgi:hypothetical protein